MPTLSIEENAPTLLRREEPGQAVQSEQAKKGSLLVFLASQLIKSSRKQCSVRGSQLALLDPSAIFKTEMVLN